jgi:hypothetical protein
MPLVPHTIDDFANHGDTESTERIFLPDRETAIGQTGNPPKGWDSKRSAEKISQPFGHDLVHRWLDINGCSRAKELSPEAKALFPGRRLPAREKSPSSVSSVPLWLIHIF